jgi:hypothetical protein
MLALYFKKQEDAYPIFQQIYDELKKSGYTFPEPVRYLEYSIYSAAPHKPAAAYHQEKKPAPTQQRAKTPNYITTLTKQDKYAKLRSDWKLLIDNIKLTNVCIERNL